MCLCRTILKTLTTKTIFNQTSYNVIFNKLNMEFYRFNNSTKHSCIITSNIPNYSYQFILNMWFAKGYSEKKKKTLKSSGIQILRVSFTEKNKYHITNNLPVYGNDSNHKNTYQLLSICLCAWHHSNHFIIFIC